MNAAAHSSPILVIWEENSPPYDPMAGGIATYVQHRARVLADFGIEVWWASVVSLARWSDAEQQWVERRTLPCAPWRRRLAMRWPTLSPVWRELMAVERMKIFEFTAGVTCWLPRRRRSDLRIVFCCHTSSLTRAFLNRDEKIERHMGRFASWARRNLRHADGVSSCSGEIAMLEAGYFHFHPDRLRILFHAFSREADPGGASLEARPPMDGDFLVIGNVEYFKGLDLIIAGFDAYRRAGGRRRLLIAGCRGLEELGKPSDQRMIGAVRRLLAEHGEDALRFLGRLDKDQLARERAHCAAVVIGSRFEAFTMVAGEAFLQGCPLILSERTGWRTLAERHHAARLIDPYDPADIAAALREMENAEARARFIRGGDAVAAYLTSRELAGKTANFYLDIVAGKDGRKEVGISPASP